MKIYKLKYLLPVLSALLFLKCQEVFEPESLNSNQKIIVINGSLNDLDASIIVSINYASAFDKDNSVYIKDASVWLKDDTGNSFQMQSLGNGNYKIGSSEVNIRENINYYIHVEISDGKTYESIPQMLPGKIDISDISAEIGEKTDDAKNVYGEVITQTFKGLYLYINAKSSDENRKFIRFENTAVYQTQYSYATSSPMPVTVRCVDYSKLNSLPVVESTLSGIYGEEVRNREIGFVSYIMDYSTRSGDTTARSSVGWVIISNSYSLTGESYNYYKKIQKQVSAENKMFDPVPSQIVGNIRCTSNPDEVALGFFEVSRGVRKYCAFAWSTGQKSYRKKELETYNAPDGSFCTDTVPEFDWINFN